MDNKLELIITEAIEKAQANGWPTLNNFQWSIHQAGGYSGLVVCARDDAKMLKVHIAVAEILYNHDFAKALWPECGTWTENGKGWVAHDGWQFHLQQMAINRDPFQYLGEHLS